MARRRIGAWNLFAFIPAALLASNRSFTGWCTGGLETQFFSLLVIVAFVRLLIEHEQKNERPFASSLLLALATLTRPEGLIFAAVAGLFMLLSSLRTRCSLRFAVFWSLPLISIVGTHFLWRKWYYGFWLPNTFYAKVSGFWWEQASKYLRLFLDDYWLLLFLPCLLLYPLLKRDATYLLFVMALAFYVVYVGYIGGDILEFRFMVPVLPFLFCLVGFFCHEQFRMFQRGFASRLAALVPLLLIGVAVARHGRAQPAMIRDGIETFAWMRHYARQRTGEGKSLKALVERGILPSDLRYSTGAAGASPYYSELYTLDFHGLNDTYIAHMPIQERGRPGHEKRATREYFKQKEIAVIDTLQGVVYDKPPARTVIGDPPKYCIPPLKCAAFDGGYLICETALTDDELTEMLGNLKFLPYPLSAP